MANLKEKYLNALAIQESIEGKSAQIDLLRNVLAVVKTSNEWQVLTKLKFHRYGILSYLITETGRVLIVQDEQKSLNVAIYARVSSSENKDNLERQKDRLISYCNAKSYQVCKIVVEIGSGQTIEIINPQLNEKEDLMQDFVSIITSFTARFYGQRRTKRKTEQLIKQLEECD